MQSPLPIPRHPDDPYGIEVREAVELLMLARSEKITRTGKKRLIKAAIAVLEEALGLFPDK